MDIKVSVIIPVFNTASYLKDAIESVGNQTLKEIEIIAVNDGSLDNSLEVLNELAALDSRLKVYSYDKNVGVSVCRNTGLKQAVGEYVYFFDSDDILEPDCLELCYKKMLTGAYDFLVFDGVSFAENGMKAGFNATYQRTRLLTKNVYNGTELIHLMISEKSYSCSVCLCFLKKSFIEANQLQFYPGVLYEDVLFAAQMYLSAKSVSFVPESFFRRRVRENSTMTSRVSAKNISYRFTVGNELLKLKKQFTDDVSHKILNHQARSLFVFLTKSIVRNRQFGLLFRFGFKILMMILRSI